MSTTTYLERPTASPSYNDRDWHDAVAVTGKPLPTVTQVNPPAANLEQAPSSFPTFISILPPAVLAVLLFGFAIVAFLSSNLLVAVLLFTVGFCMGTAALLANAVRVRIKRHRTGRIAIGPG